MADLIFLRHGQTEWNVQRRLQGHDDSPLTAVGRAQAAAHGEALRPLAPQRIWCSPLGRTRATAAIVAAALGLDAGAVETVPELRERGMGRFEGWTLDAIERQHPDAHAAREADPWHWRAAATDAGVPGENYDDLMQRTAPLVARLAAVGAVAGAPLVVVSHGTLVRPLLGQLLGLTPAVMLSLRQPNHVRYRLAYSAADVRVFHSDGGPEQPGLMRV